MVDAILQGTTPGIAYDFSEYDFDVTTITKIELAIINGGKRTIYGLDDVTVDGEANSITINFSHEETIEFVPDEMLTHQILMWFPDGNVIGTEEGYIDVKKWIGKGARE